MIVMIRVVMFVIVIVRMVVMDVLVISIVPVDNHFKSSGTDALLHHLFTANFALILRQRQLLDF
jgi:hypothetical protein